MVHPLPSKSRPTSTSKSGLEVDDEGPGVVVVVGVVVVGIVVVGGVVVVVIFPFKMSSIVIV